jgi:hypothetical protein
MVCHSNHAVHDPSTAMLVGPKAVCSGCHDAGTGPAGTATQMAGWLDGLDNALKHSETLLASAEKSGMEVSEAQVRLIDGRENLVKARLAFHSMKPLEVQKPVEEGMAIARSTQKAGEFELHEKDTCRMGLGVSGQLIGIVILAIRRLLRRMESN